ncbi:basement membrane-specific heparan sulfate proteoglycan core protein [Trichonephila inaurata madagascariensis]|uniref:Basement membrane-specific heparan sulfate proteoglycan core protein n=1 Tax=Trichonephila inaurata madagascariensis TaxID=2747483 RepID=A0A8X6IMG3_9ARAC|nr:basement membrane-specific heparan sulfate proteoglycan core protein [Trichonephila inaurata madagascariensis]
MDLAVAPTTAIIYFRIGFTITNLQYTPELAQKASPEFRRVAEELILALEALYRTIHGQQAVTVISFRPLTHSSREHVLVTLDVGSLGNNDRSSIERVIKEAIINGNVGRYTVSDENFSIRGFGAPSQPLPTSDECPPDHLSCSSGECINILKRCDGREDCRDGSDEIGCHRTQTSDLIPKFDSGCRSDNQMICQDGTCIDTIRVCDGVKDCSFGEDEQNCGITTCPPGQFQCDGSRCVDERRRCDGRPDCSDRSDEADCEKPKACQPDEFRCGDGQCIKEFLKCDRRYDCQDGSDELSCEPGRETICQPNEFRCGNGQCIDNSLKCDRKYDCQDGTDELSCESKTCQPNEFRCTNGQCIDASLKCDRKYDCQDGTDELSCEPKSCQPNEFRCGNGQCIDNSLKCDRKYDCQDGTDELSCEPTTCQPNEFRCTNGQCIDSSLKCDRKYDCQDGTDELSCEPATCQPNEFRCNNGQCIDNTLKCDRKYDCQDGTDELSCVPQTCQLNEFRCSNGQCIGSSLKCDRKYDCQDGTDELSCVPETCQPNEFRCGNGQCINNSLKCDRKYDCQDGTDELSCVSQTCEPNEFRCGNGQCIDNSLKCDRKYDCQDGTDELSCVSETCQPNEFRCANGQCIDNSLKCDRKYDCQDGTDELSCVPEKCQPNEFRCGNGQCIENSLKCDRKYDCQDGTDELSCVPKTCQPNEFRCGNGQCIDNSLKCDRKYDCQDGTDELSCVPQTCQPNEFRCGNGQCIDNSLKCDRKYDCQDGTDELSCELKEPKDCEPGEFRCSNGQCIDGSLKCDRKYDCQDGTDELSCEPSKERTCQPNEFRCSNGQCIDNSLKCDRKYDCQDGSDELSCESKSCEPNEFRCSNGQCIDSSLKCDRKYDCQDGTDELSCEPSRESRCRADEFRCGNGQCIDSSLKCDRKYDCQDGTDELSCEARTCERDQFRCSDGQCINSAFKCDRKYDCQDGSDELSCGDHDVQTCKADEFQCSTGECIKFFQRCDMVVDCPNSEDESFCQEIHCAPDEFHCNDKSCVESYQRCDGKPDCPDGSDEKNCTGVVCPPGTFRCDNGSCIDLFLRCDGRGDCPDRSGADERGCPCSPSQWQCDFGQCLDRNKLCDGTVDCPDDNSDERDCGIPGCTPDKFRCSDGTCIPAENKCNGRRECRDGSDERNCPCPSDKFMCENKFCIDLRRRCDGYNDCQDSSDEKDCPGECEANQFRCADGKTCIPASAHCDRKYDCLDGSDELDCRRPTTQCRFDQYRCSDGMCLNIAQRCDGNIDCSGGEDEAGCGTCPENQFRCSDGSCINIKLRCNGEFDCRDSSDESNCEIKPICRITDFTCRDGTCVNQTIKCDGVVHCQDGDDESICNRCGVGEYVCNNGQCIESRQRCDGRSHCPNGEDEADCPVECQSGQFRCKNGQCINELRKCDGRPDCADSSDELDCGVCKPGDIICRDGSCVDPSKRCDGRRDCSEGIDEENCECLPNEFRCGDGNCISEKRRCDGYPDCRDRTDEVDCEKCAENMFKCGDGTCIDLRRRCDGRRDCFDNADEENCEPKTCSPEEFRCNNGECIAISLKCDRKYDCRDGSDEFSCEPKACEADEFRCRDGQCIESSLRCNRQYDCRDGSDELDCAAVTCSANQFRCNNGECIDNALKCDRKYDCRDGSDEFNCVAEVCEPNQFRCSNGQCIDGNLKCDRKYDCSDGSDETSCNARCQPSEFQCGDGTCVESQVRCDGRNDCPDRSDEKDCGCTPTQFQCNNGECVDSRSRCDGIPDCNDGSDERDCQECDTDEFRCGDGKCIYDIFRCDGLYDCADYSDEQECETRLCRPSQFRCVTGLCIDRAKYCDGLPDCPDRSDELDCRACQAGGYVCANGQCIERFQRCDGTFDCSDYSDESDCAPEGGINIKVYPERQSIRQGREVVFRCRDEGTRRSPVKWIRADNLAMPPGYTDRGGRLTIPNIQPEHSGVYICTSAGPARGTTSSAQKAAFLSIQPFVPPTSRPTRPPGACSRTEATCQNGECIPRAYACDGDFDCTDRSDELNCDYQYQCQPNEFQCDNKKCVLKVWRCDGDNDCGDNSDEKSCSPNPAGSPCRYDEYRCLSGDQCIPKSFQCDGEFDCQDKSDEIGCASPTITQPPPETMTVEEGETVTIVCTAVGNPTPIISWRLNWGNIPAGPRVSVSSENGRGTVTIREARQTDQGAWSCEAINSKDSVLAIPDTVLVVKPKAGVCRPPLFNEKASVSSDCLRCFCFGVTETCYSSSLHVIKVPLQTEISIVALQRDGRGNYEDVGQRYPPNQNAIQYNSANREYKVESHVRNDAPSDVYHYWSLPPEFLGNQLNSYGGYIHFMFRYSSPFPRSTPNIADIILKGNDMTLYHVMKQPFGPQRDNNVEVRLWEGEWHKNEAQGRGDAPFTDVTTRQDIMMVLQNIETFYVRATYDDEMIHSSILNFQMDSASLSDPSAPQAVFVEKCSCPQGYTGNSCEECAEGYSRRKTGSGLGDCVPSRVPCNCHGHSSLCDPVSGECLNCRHNSEGRQCERCKRGYFGDARRGTPDDCQPCPCPLITTPNQFSPTCVLDTDGQVTCDACPIGYEGRRCERCGPGYDGNPNIPGGSCRVHGGLQCDPVGSLTPDPSRTTGLCQCKSYVTGARCDQCKPHTFYLNSESPLGCIDCFCMGITETCSSSTWYRDDIILSFTSSSQGVTLTNILRSYNINQNLQVDSRNRELVFRNFATQPAQTYYWKMPQSFLGDKVTAYGGRLNYTVMYVPGSRADPNLDPDVQIMGNGIVLVYRHPELIRPSSLHSISIPMYETSWLRSDGQPATREHLLMTLADLDAILIKATYTGGTTSASLADVSFTIAVDRPTDGPRALAVEQCRCPIGYTGLSCEDCDAGYTRSGAGLYLGLCEPCFCNSHSSDCDPETGICRNCQHNTGGDFCEECLSGYVGDASGGTPNDCQPAIEPTCQCDSRGSLGLECDYRNNCPCKPNVQGRNCNQCKEGFFNLESRNPEGCAPCFCFGVTQQCSSSSYYRNQIAMRLEDLADPYNHNFQLTSRFRTRTITEGIIVNPSQNEVSFTSFPREPEQTETLFWSLPAQFLGNKLASYGGKLRYTQQYLAGDGGDLYADADVEMTGNGISVFYVNIPTLNPQEVRTFEIELRETNWQRVDSRGPTSATREDFMKVLANVEALLIRASFHNRMHQTLLKDVQMDTAVPQSTGQGLATEVEQCVCPPGYIGLSCEECAPGYIRDASGPGLGRCTRCNCNGHSESCDATTGSCVRCRHNTVGESCERCADGFYGDATRGTPEDCKPCPCPLTTPPNQFSPTCFLDNDGQPTCNACPPGYIGRNCEKCASGYRGTPVQPGGRCEPTGGVSPTIRVRVEEPRTQRLPVGATVTFRCTGVSQVSDVTYTLVWTKEGAAMPAQATEASGVLSIPNVRPEDTGTYICTGSDLTSVAQDRATLLVEGTGRPTPPRVTIEPHFQEVKVGDPIEFRCIAEGFPEPQLRWTGGRNNQINPQATFVAGFFRIPSARKSDEAEYFCSATNAAGSESMRTVLLVRGEDTGKGEEPQLTISPSTYEAQRLETVKFQCRVTATPTPSITWSFSGGQLPEDSSQVGGVLTLPRVTENHQGVYVCTASNVHGTAQAQARLLIASRRSPPTARVEPERQTIMQGSSGELRCIVGGIPRPTVSWSKVGADLSNRHRVQEDNLYISDVTVEDRGLYVCRAENRDGSAQASAIVEVERREVPAIELYPEATQTVIRGGSSLFQCRVTAGIPTPTVEWVRADGSPFTSSTEILNGGVIRFNRVTGDEEGTYICTAENSGGRVTAQAVLQIQGAPTVKIIQANPYRVRPGETVRFECLSEGDPRPNVSWRKLRHPLVSYAASDESIDGKALLEIRRVSQSDSGVYICSARSSAGVTEERIQLIVEETDSVVPEVMVEDRVTTTTVNSSVELRCFVRGTDRDIYLKWTRTDGGQIPVNHRLQDGVLYIPHVQPEDAGEYSCLGIVEGDVILFTARARLAVVAPPRIQLNPPRQTARPGDIVRIQCSAIGDQPIAIDWSRIGGYLSPSMVQAGGILTFQGITANDAGRYLCTAANAAGKAEGVAEVIVNEETPLDYVRKEETAFVGSNIQLKCAVSGSPAPQLDWSKDGGPLPDNAKVINNELWLRDVRMENAGRYICTASNSAGRTRDYVILNVRAVPTLEVKIESNKEIVNMGDTLDLRCKVTGDASARISWYKVAQDGPLPENVRIRGPILVINGVKPENGGVYRCSVESYAGTFTDDYVLAMQVPPTVTPDLVETRTAPFGSTVVMDCKTTLDPPVAYTWYKQGGVLPLEATTNGGQLTIPDVKGEDAGTYICTAKSPVGTIDVPTILIVTGVVPYFSQTPLSYMRMPTLSDAYLSFEVEIAFKPESMNGLLLYNGQKQEQGDFIALVLNNGYVEFRFELGSGPAVIRSTEPVEMRKWHTVHIRRERKDGFLRVDDRPEVTGSAQGKFLGLDLVQPMYIGSVPDFGLIESNAGALRGFIGCISHYKTGKVVHNLLREAESYGISTCETCSSNPCLHGGVCQEALTMVGYNCICPPGFSGRDCEKVGEACYPGVCGEGRCINKPGGGFDCFCPLRRTGVRCEKDIIIVEPAFSDDAYIAYPTPNALTTLKMNMRVKPRTLDDCLIAYCAQHEDGSGDFTSIAIRNKSVEFRFDMGSGPAIIRSQEPLLQDDWLSIVAERDMREGSLIVNDGIASKGMSPGITRGLNLHTPFYIGAVDKHKISISPYAEVQHGFDGCIAHVEVNGVDIDLVNSAIDASNVEDCGSRTPCEKNPCLNDGICIEEEGSSEGFVCECQEGYRGKHCEIETDLCSLIDPCKNGGTCVGSGNSYQCSCPIRFKGTNCEEASVFDERVSFQGNGYLALENELLPHTATTKDEVVSFSFTTTSLEGLLLFHGQKPDTDGKGQDYLAAAIIDGFLEFSYELGSGPAQIKSPVKVNDGKVHSIVLKRTGRHGSLELDGIHQEFGESKGILQMLNTDGDIYIGGVPNHQLMTAGKYPQGLIGCLWNLQIDDSGPLNLFDSAKTGANVQDCDNYEASGEFLEELEGRFVQK